MALPRDGLRDFSFSKSTWCYNVFNIDSFDYTLFTLCYLQYFKICSYTLLTTVSCGTGDLQHTDKSYKFY